MARQGVVHLAPSLIDYNAMLMLPSVMGMEANQDGKAEGGSSPGIVSSCEVQRNLIPFDPIKGHTVNRRSCTVDRL